MEFKRPWSDGTRHIALEPKALLSRLGALVPPPRRHVTVYSGVLSSHSKWRSQIVPKPKEVVENPAPEISEPIQGEKKSKGSRSKYIPWSELLRRTFGSEAVCPHCGGRLRLIALVKTEQTIRKILSAMHLPTGPPPIISSRPPVLEAGDMDWGEENRDWMD